MHIKNGASAISRYAIGSLLFLSMNLNQFLNIRRQRIDQIVNVLGGVVVAKADTQSTFGLVLGRAKGEECTAKLFGVRRASRAARNTDAALGERVYHRLALNIGE